MAFSSITNDIMLIHIVPLLADPDIRALAQCSQALASIVGPLRFQTCSVRRYGGYFRHCLSADTIKTIRHLSLDGLGTDHDEIFACGDLLHVVSAKIVTMIQPRQKVAFGMWARQLVALREEDVCDGEDRESSLSNIPAGSFETLQDLCLEVSLPLGMDDTLGIALNLRRIQFFPTYPQTTEAGYMYYLGELKVLLGLVSDSARVPSLKILHIGPTSVTLAYQKVPHRELMQSIWTAAHCHGGWKLECSLPDTFVPIFNPGAWEWWWGRQAWDLTITVKEIKEFTNACERRNVVPRLAEYVQSRIHVQTSGGTPHLQTLLNANTVVYALWIEHGPTTDITATLKLVTKDTRSFAISVRSYWGSVGDLVPNATPFQQVEALLMAGPSPGHLRQSFAYKNNYCVAFIKALAVRSWSRLVNLSLPAIAFQRKPVNGVPYLSECGLHVGGYDMEWLAELSTLKAFFITKWFSCAECFLAANVKFETGLTHVPSSVEFVSIGGRMGYMGDIIPEWLKSYPAHLRSILGGNRSDVLVSFRRLILVRIITPEEFAQMRALEQLIADLQMQDEAAANAAQAGQVVGGEEAPGAEEN